MTIHLDHLKYKLLAGYPVYRILPV